MSVSWVLACQAVEPKKAVAAESFLRGGLVGSLRVMPVTLNSVVVLKWWVMDVVTEDVSLATVAATEAAATKSIRVVVEAEEAAAMGAELAEPRGARTIGPESQEEEARTAGGAAESAAAMREAIRRRPPTATRDRDSASSVRGFTPRLEEVHCRPMYHTLYIMRKRSRKKICGQASKRGGSILQSEQNNRSLLFSNWNFL